LQHRRPHLLHRAADGQLLGVDAEVDLLVGLQLAHHRRPYHLCRDRYLAFDHHKTACDHRLFLILILIDGQQVVARLGPAHIPVGDDELVVCKIVDCLKGEAELAHIILLIAVDIIEGRQIGRIPVHITMRDAVNVSLPAGIEIIEIQLQLHLTSQLDQRESILVAGDAKAHTANIVDIGMIVVDRRILCRQQQAAQQAGPYDSQLFHN